MSLVAFPNIEVVAMHRIMNPYEASPLEFKLADSLYLLREWRKTCPKLVQVQLGSGTWGLEGGDWVRIADATPISNVLDVFRRMEF